MPTDGVDHGRHTIDDRYDLQRKLGQGGMGAVWLAVDRVLGREVALKRIGDFPGGDTPGLVRAQREAKLAARLNHPHVVAVYDFVAEGEQQWLVMEHVAGTDLATLVARSGVLQPDEAAHLLAQVAGALAVAHEAGIVHRDVKPSNILITPDGSAKLADFGIARARDSTLTASGMVSGSPAYLAPEVAAGKPATEASDVWSLGATLYQALAGRTPYDTSDNVLATMYAIVHDAPPRLSDVGWPAGLLEHTMTTDPAQRWPMRRVQQYLATGPPPVEQPVSGADEPTVAETAPMAALSEEPREPAQPGGRRTMLPVLVGAVLLLLLLGIGWLVLRPGDDPQAAARDKGDRTPAAKASHTPTASGSATTAGTPSSANTPTTEVTPSDETPTQQTSTAGAPVPTSAQAMRSFVEQYIRTAVDDPESGWEMLSPRFQQDCCAGEMGNYTGYWNTIADATLRDVVADPRSMQVSYVITWYPKGRPSEDENVTLGLVRGGDNYLIDSEL